MTYKQFLSKLRKTPRDWFINSDGCIRRKRVLRFRNLDEIGRYCPILAVAGGPASHTCEWEIFAERIGLSGELAKSIMLSSDDCRIEGFKENIRRDLLLACGLK